MSSFEDDSSQFDNKWLNHHNCELGKSNRCAFCELGYNANEQCSEKLKAVLRKSFEKFEGKGKNHIWHQTWEAEILKA